MYILGLSGFAHESACALIRDGEIRCLLEEERFTRNKHTWEFPRNAIQECLRHEGITFADVQHITFFWQPLREILGNASHMLRYFPRSLHLLTSPSGSNDLRFIPRICRMLSLRSEIRRCFSLTKVPPLTCIEHHLCHAASAFLASPFREAAILTLDGRGEAATTLMAHGNGSRIQKIGEIALPHSLGLLYAAVTAHLGFQPYCDEWKVMGMSAYGTNALKKDFEAVVRVTDCGELRLNLNYFSFHVRGRRQWVTNAFVAKFGPPRRADQPYAQRHFDLALALQRSVENAGVSLARHLRNMTRLDDLCMTGGVVLNCLMNKKIAEQAGFRNIFFFPIANDAGTSAGSALYFYHHVLGRARHFVFHTAALGNEFSNDEIEKTLKARNVRYHKTDSISCEAARCIADGKVVGWFQGRMEAGPRALGYRSILADPRCAAMKERLNGQVKKREFFRPFAPSVLKEKAAEYFIIQPGLLYDYMIVAADVREDKKAMIPAVTHVDGTSRVHAVDKAENPLYWELIREFEKLTGIPVVLNTSFNENEPIICTPEQSLDCLLRTDLDALAIGDFMITKPTQDNI